MKKLALLFFTALLIISCSKKTSEEKVWEPEILKQFKKVGIASNLPDYSYAGYAYGEKKIPTVEGAIYNVSDFGAIPNDEIDDTKAINLAIKSAGENGGGIVFFPSGKFLVNTDTTKTEIVKINYSNIVMRGSGSAENGTVIFSGSLYALVLGAPSWLGPVTPLGGVGLILGWMSLFIAALGWRDSPPSK